MLEGEKIIADYYWRALYRADYFSILRRDTDQTNFRNRRITIGCMNRDLLAQAIGAIAQDTKPSNPDVMVDIPQLKRDLPPGKVFCQPRSFGICRYGLDGRGTNNCYLRRTDQCSVLHQQNEIVVILRNAPLRQSVLYVNSSQASAVADPPACTDHAIV